MIDWRIAHNLDGRTLLNLLPHVDQSDLHTLRQEFAQYLTTRAASSHQTWQEAWNAWTGATPHTPGQITYTPPRCKDCHGKGFTHRHVQRNLTRTGNPYLCGTCRGTRRGTRTRQPARYAPIPEPATTQTGETP